MTALSDVGEFQLRAVLDSIPARVALIDRERRHLYVNQEYARFLGRDPAAVFGHRVSDVIGQAAFEVVRPLGERALAGETVRWDGWLPYADGQRFVQRIYMPYRNERGAVDGYFVFARDLTELKRSEAMSQAITAASLDCIIAADAEGRVVAFNPAAERTFGYAKEEVLGRKVT